MQDQIGNLLSIQISGFITGECDGPGYMKWNTIHYEPDMYAKSLHLQKKDVYYLNKWLDFKQKTKASNMMINELTNMAPIKIKIKEYGDICVIMSNNKSLAEVQWAPFRQINS